MPRSLVLAFVGKEFWELLPTIAFFFISFNLVELTTQLILADYQARPANFLLATTMALVLGKAVLVVLPFLHRFDTAPLIRPTLFKTIVYWAVVFLLIKNWIGGGTLSQLSEYTARHFSWHRFTAIQI